jgi:hypothetical protein
MKMIFQHWTVRYWKNFLRCWYIHHHRLLWTTL